MFDPLGLISPVLINAKLILQELWQLQLNWDETIPMELEYKWKLFLDNLHEIATIKIPRLITADAEEFEMHTFCDASELAYGACIYIRSIKNDKTMTVNLLAAKTRVSPLSKKLTIPKLELNAAIIATNLADKFKQILRIPITKEIYWSDSTITLAWIKGSPQKWKVYVANRVNHIQQLTNKNHWHHVRTKDNPADVLSRGCSPVELQAAEFWWHGPTWLSSNNINYSHHINFDSTEEIRNERKTLVTQTHEKPIYENYSSLRKALWIIALILRFKNNCLQRTKPKVLSANLTLNELTQARKTLIKLAQTTAFKDEIKSLSTGKSLNSRSTILSLTPFTDEEGILRVGGRLQESNLSFESKHPIILPKGNHLTKLIIKEKHLEAHHAGTNLLLSLMRERYWPIDAKNSIKKIIEDCVTCCRYKSNIITPRMGNLPKPRITPSSPFTTTGVDYAGPYMIKDRKHRKPMLTKAYIALFVCFCTKAIHLELVSDLTSESFIASLKRFISRRGKPSSIYSDNGTTFIGTINELKNLQQFFKLNSDIIQKAVQDIGIDWHLIPPYSPNFGGLWEAGVKSVKFHLKRILKTSILPSKRCIPYLPKSSQLLIPDH